MSKFLSPSLILEKKDAAIKYYLSQLEEEIQLLLKELIKNWVFSCFRKGDKKT